jgi:CheY-like chemotaxis protein
MKATPLKRVLLVEDDETRCSWFRQKLASHVLDITCDVGQAIAWLTEREYTAILLDHDLADEHYFSDEPDDERTGYAIAAWLASHPDRQLSALIVIHSLNYVGAKRMLDLLQDAGRDAQHVPFHFLQAGLRM